MNKKGLVFAFSVFGVATLGIVGMATYAASDSRFGVYRQVEAARFNTMTFDIRNDGVGEEPKTTMTYTSKYTADGLELHVTAGHFEDWAFGLVKWNIPVEKGSTYWCEFTLKVDSYGENAAVFDDKGKDHYKFSSIRIETKEKSDTGYCGDFTKNELFTIGGTFTSTHDEPYVLLKLGGIRAVTDRDFTVTVKDFQLKSETNVGELLQRVSFESGEAFAARWNAANVDMALCSASEDNVKELIYGYCDLVPAQREIAAAVAANPTEKHPTSTVGESVAYFANRYGVPLE